MYNKFKENNNSILRLIQKSKNENWNKQDIEDLNKLIKYNNILEKAINRIENEEKYLENEAIYYYDTEIDSDATAYMWINFALDTLNNIKIILKGEDNE